jgi:hypothetical protein
MEKMTSKLLLQTAPLQELVPSLQDLLRRRVPHR